MSANGGWDSNGGSNLGAEDPSPELQRIERRLTSN